MTEQDASAPRARISVVIPARDDAGPLATCLDSLARQSRPADEIIVVDNDSADRTAHVALEHGVILASESRLGIWPAAAAGFDLATGDIIARCDADSRLPADWLERIERQLRAHPEAVAITGPARFYDLGRIARWAATVFYLQAYFWSTRAALARWPVFGSNFAIRSSAWRAVRERVHREDSEVHDDLDLSLQLDPVDRVHYDRGLVVGISGRPFSSARGMRKRFRRAGRTFRRSWPEQLPWKRWRRRLRGDDSQSGS